MVAANIVFCIATSFDYKRGDKMTVSKLLQEEDEVIGAPYVRRILQVCKDKKVLIKAGIEHRELLERAGFVYVKNATEIRRLTSFERVAVTPCACGNLYSAMKICKCNEKLLAVYENRMQNLHAKADVIIRIDNNRTPSLGDLTPPFINCSPQDYEIDGECINLLNMMMKRFVISKENLLNIATALASLDNQKKLSKAYLLEACSFLRA